MDNNLILTANRFWDSVTEHCASSVDIPTDLDMSSFMSGPGIWTLGTDNVNDPDRCVKRLSNYSYPVTTMGEYAEYISSYDNNYCISISMFEDYGEDYTTMASLPTGTDDKLIRYGDLNNNVDYTIFASTVSNSYTLGQLGTGTYSGYVYVYLCLQSSQYEDTDYDDTATFSYHGFKYTTPGYTNNVEYGLIIVEENALGVVDRLKITVSVTHTSAYTVQSVSCNSNIVTSNNFTKTYSSKTSTTFVYTRAMSTNEITSMLNNTISNSFTISIVSANTSTPLTQRFVADLNGEWMTGSTNPNSSTYYSFQSGKNKGVDSSMDSMYIRFSGYSQFDFYIRSNGEINYDYVMVSQLNTDITSGTSFQDTSLVKAHTRGLSTTSTALTAHTSVSFTGLSTSSAYTIQVGYRKDTSTALSADTGYVLIPKTSGTYINMYTIPKSTLSWETFYFTNANGTRIFLDSTYINTNNSVFYLYTKDFSLVTSGSFISGVTGGSNYIQISNDSFGGYSGQAYIVFEFKNVYYTQYGTFSVAFPVDISSAGITSDYGECFIFSKNTGMDFMYNYGSVNRPANFMIYPSNVLGLSSDYAQTSNGVLDGFGFFVSSLYLQETNGWPAYDYQMSGQNYTYVFSPADNPNVSLIPSAHTTLINVCYWYYTYMNGASIVNYYITPA